MSSLEDARWEARGAAKDAEASVAKFNRQLAVEDLLTGFTDVAGTPPVLTWPHSQPSDGPPEIQCTGCQRIWVVDRTYTIDEPDSPTNHECAGAL
jgi:hypothetical protein